MCIFLSLSLSFSLILTLSSFLSLSLSLAPSLPLSLILPLSLFLSLCVAADVHDAKHLKSIWGGYGLQVRLNYRSLSQNIVSFIGLFAKRDL